MRRQLRAECQFADVPFFAQFCLSGIFCSYTFCPSSFATSAAPFHHSMVLLWISFGYRCHRIIALLRKSVLERCLDRAKQKVSSCWQFNFVKRRHCLCSVCQAQRKWRQPKKYKGKKFAFPRTPLVLKEAFPQLQVFLGRNSIRASKFLGDSVL